MASSCFVDEVKLTAIRARRINDQLADAASKTLHASGATGATNTRSPGACSRAPASRGSLMRNATPPSLSAS